MEITITIPKSAIKMVKVMAKELTGKTPSAEQLEKFFTEDIMNVYNETFDDGIDEAVGAYFG